MEESQKGKQAQTKEKSILNKGEELEVPIDFETSSTILEHMRNYYKQYESMNAHHEEMKDLVDLTISLGVPIKK